MSHAFCDNPKDGLCFVTSTILGSISCADSNMSIASINRSQFVELSMVAKTKMVCKLLKPRFHLTLRHCKTISVLLYPGLSVRDRFQEINLDFHGISSYVLLSNLDVEQFLQALLEHDVCLSLVNNKMVRIKK